jgi:hypothetical protein
MEVGKGCGMVNMVKCSVYMYVNAEMRPVETLLRIGEEE